MPVNKTCKEEKMIQEFQYDHQKVVSWFNLSPTDYSKYIRELPVLCSFVFKNSWVRSASFMEIILLILS